MALITRSSALKWLMSTGLKKFGQESMKLVVNMGILLVFEVCISLFVDCWLKSIESFKLLLQNGF